jgi:polyisoprenoid-binding protein YceI
MPMHAACKIHALTAIAIAIAIGVVGCATRAHKGEPIPQGAPVHAVPAAVGQAYHVIGSESLLIVRVYRGGTLARVGHNHIVASHELAGTVYVPKDPLRSTFELKFPVASLTVDEAELRAAQGADFATEAPDNAARDGTRRNMLGPAVLDADHFPEITLRSAGLEAGADRLMTRIEIGFRGQEHVHTVPVSFTLTANELLAQGEFPLKQSDIGLQPFTALLGALAVQDEMQLQFRIVARAE